jgi:hypothetical protein
MGARLSWKVVLTTVVLLIFASCASPPGEPRQQPEEPMMEGEPQDVWSELRKQPPYPYHVSLITGSTTPLDGEFVKVDPRPGERAGCRRCPPYPPEGGVWRLALDQGAFYVMHPRTEWKTLGSFSLSGDQITFSNDPHCPQDVGLYNWRVEAGQLILEMVEDECGWELRAKILAAQPWLACQPTSEEAAVTVHWSKPEPCE